MFLDLKIWVCINGKFLHGVTGTILVPPTEHIDVSCELAAAVVDSWLVHLLHLFPLLSVGVIPMTPGQLILILALTSCDIDKPGVYYTHAVERSPVTEWSNLFATDNVVLGDAEHPKISATIRRLGLKYRIPVKSDRTPVS